MCKTYNTIGSLTALKSHLVSNNIHDFKSLRDVMDFQRSFTILRQHLIAEHEKLIEQEKNSLTIEIQQLNTTIDTKKQQSEQRLTDEINQLKQELNTLAANVSTSIFQKLVKRVKYWRYKKKIKHKENNFDSEIELSISNLVNDYHIKNNRYQFISENVDEAVKLSVQYNLAALERKKTIVDQANTSIYGALGEQKVVKTLESLSDDYHLINDFTLFFVPAIYNRQENDYIKSIQIDHLLVGPSGIFLIETKNWSEKSLENLSLRSPVQQIKRTSFVLFKLLNNDMSNNYLQLSRHHWGDKKVTIKNLIVLTNTKPKEEFQHVKILTVNELLGYVNYFKPSLSNTETQRIVEFLLRISNQTTSL